MSKNFLKTENVEFNYPKTSSSFLKNINFELQQGDIFGLLGPNGAGKTTLIKILIGKLKPQKGNVSFLGKDPFIFPEIVKNKLGYAPQKASVYQNLKVDELLDFYDYLFKTNNKKQIIKEFELEKFTNDIVANLSGGQIQRISLALSMLGNPKVLILDEPTNNLDPKARFLFWETIKKRQANGLAILLSTHMLEEIESVSNKLLILDKGNLLINSSTEKFILDYGTNNAVFSFKNGFNIEDLNISNLLINSIKKISANNYQIYAENLTELINIIFKNNQKAIPELLQLNYSSLNDAYISLIEKNGENKNG